MGQLNCCTNGQLPTVFKMGAPGEFERPFGPSKMSQPRSLVAAVEQKGLRIWVDSVEDLARSLPFGLDADLEHLYHPPPPLPPPGSRAPQGGGAGGGGEAGPAQEAKRDPPDFARDIGMRCERSTGPAPEIPWSRSLDGHEPMFADNQDNYALIQVDDPHNPWGVYAVSDGEGPDGHLLSTLLVHELPGLLAQNPNFHSHTSLALHQSFVAAGEMSSTCQFVDSSFSGGTLSVAMLRDSLLHIAWVGDSKIVLGRLAARPGQPTQDKVSQPQNGASPLRPVNGRRRTTPGGQRRAAPTREGGPTGPAPLLRAVELTSEQIATPPDKAAGGTGAGSASGSGAWSTSADGAGGPPAAAGGRVRMFGNSNTREACAPEVRRMRLRAEDVFVILGTSGLWKRLSPSEAVTIVGQNLHRMASDAAEALAAEVNRRAAAFGLPVAEDLTVIVVYLAGDSYVNDFDPQRATHLQEQDRFSVCELNDLSGTRCDNWLNM